MKVDYKTAQMTVFDPPTEDSGVYSVQGDPKSKPIWFSQQHADQIARFGPATRAFTEFPLANAEEDHRRIEIDPTNSKRIWWTGIFRAGLVTSNCSNKLPGPTDVEEARDRDLVFAVGAVFGRFLHSPRRDV